MVLLCVKSNLVRKVPLAATSSIDTTSMKGKLYAVLVEN